MIKYVQNKQEGVVFVKKICKIIALLCISVCLVTMLSFGASATGLSFMCEEEWDVLIATNRNRTENDMTPFSTFAPLNKAAEKRGEEITRFFSHERPDGTDFQTVYDELGVEWMCCGENIAAGQKTAETVVSAWMNSPGHRANILEEGFKHLGVGYGKANDLYKHYWSQNFVGGCKTTGIKLHGGIPGFDRNGSLVTKEAMLAVTCDLHGTAYLPLISTDYVCNGTKEGATTVTVKYDGLTVTLTAAVGFADVSRKDWYYSAVTNAVKQGWFNGVTQTTFEPGSSMTRAMLVTVLYRMEGEPAVKGTTNFTDLKGSWYKTAVAWAAQNGIVNGIDATHFAPDAPVTREQIAAILYRYTQYKGIAPDASGNYKNFADAAEVSAYARSALNWAIGEELVKGKPENRLDPKGNATRAEVATILTRYQNK